MMSKTKKNKKPNKKSARIILTIFLFLFVLFILLRVAEIKNLIKIISNSNPFWLLLALFFQYLSFLFASLSMHEMFLDMNVKVRVWFLTKLNIAATFVDAVLPSQGISAGFFMFKALAKQNLEQGKRAIHLIFSFTINYAVFIILFAVSIFYFYLNFKSIGITIGLSLFLFIIVAFFLLFLFIFFVSQDLAVRIINRLPLKLINKFIKNFDERSKNILIGFYKERKKYKFDFYRYGLLMFLSYVCKLLAFFLAILSLNYNLSFDKVIISFVFSSILSIISYVKLGFFELGLVLSLLALGIEYNLALATALVFRLISFWIPFVFGYVFFRKIIKE